MRWEGERESSEVEDRRGMSIGRGGALIGGGGLVLVLLFSMLTGADPRQVLEIAQGVSNVGRGPTERSRARWARPRDATGRFAAVVLGSTEDVWGEVFAEKGRHYERPRLVLFSDAVQSACGTAQSAVGPFYCPRDSQVYLDLSFFQELEQRFGAPGDFARAYVIAHEVGHHVQNLLGLADKVSAAQQRGSRERGQRAVGAHGAAGRLPGRRLGQPREPRAQLARSRRRRGGPRGRRGDRRRHAAAPGRRRGAAGELDARLVGDAREVAAARGLESGDIERVRTTFDGQTPCRRASSSRTAATTAS